jgi:hypothetical protein
MKFNTNELKVLDIVELNNNELYMHTIINDELLLTGIGSETWRAIQFLKEGEILSVYRANSNMDLNYALINNDVSKLKLIWEREQEVEVTLEEAMKIVSEKLGVKVENLKIKK